VDEMKHPLLLVSILALVCIPFLGQFALAKQGHITLLTVSEGTEEPTGGTADLTLDIRPGTGRIFIDSLPHTRIDTQISIRFAQEFACSFLEKDCNRYDFFYTIRADSSIVGGPSAGVPLTVLTISVLGNLPLANDTVATGTITAGGLVGPVSGITEKATAARDAGFHRVLIPPFEIHAISMTEESSTNASNASNDSVENPVEGKNTTTNLTAMTPDEPITGIEVIKVATIEDALYYFTGKNMTAASGNISILPEYTTRMAVLAHELCNRTVLLNESALRNASLQNTTDARYAKGVAALEVHDYYSAASYCFSANVLLREAALEGYSSPQLVVFAANVSVAVRNFEERLDQRELVTLSDLETYMVVKERLREVNDVLTEINMSNASAYSVAYSIERYNSAVSWSKLFGIPGAGLRLDDNHLKEACQKKMSETEDRFNYVNLYVDGLLGDVRKALLEADDAYREGRYAECLFAAAKAKAEANMLLSGITIPKDEVDGYIGSTLDAARRVIVAEEKKGMFPLLGYSYYEYAYSLRQDDPLSSLTFAEYSLEMSNLDMYFPKEKSGSWRIDFGLWPLFLYGALFGASVSMVFFILVFRKLHKEERKLLKESPLRRHQGRSGKKSSQTRKRVRPSPNR
jgi:uncharacterized protein